MLSYLKGTLLHKSPTEIVVDVNNIGYAVNITLSTFEKLPAINSAVTILTYLHVREDAIQLFGFGTEAEREIFKLLISISGIGPKMAQTILSGILPSDLQNYIMQGNVSALIGIPGVGRKTAERMIVELREKMTRIETGVPQIPTPQSGVRSEALLALTSLGYNRAAAEKAIRDALTEVNGEEISIEELLKAALKKV